MSTLLIESPATLIARARLWRWAADTFWYPGHAFLARLGDPAHRAALDDDAQSAGEGGAIVIALATVWQSCGDAVPNLPSLPEEYTALFERQVHVSPHETNFVLGPSADPAPSLAEIGGMYAAFGFQPGGRRPARPDHHSVECEFVAVLLAKEAYALARGWQSRARLTRKAREVFLQRHPAAWFPAFAAQIAKHSRLGFYPASAALTLALLTEEGETLDLSTADVRGAMTGFIAERDDDFRNCGFGNGEEAVLAGEAEGL